MSEEELAMKSSILIVDFVSKSQPYFHAQQIITFDKMFDQYKNVNLNTSYFLFGCDGNGVGAMF